MKIEVALKRMEPGPSGSGLRPTRAKENAGPHNQGEPNTDSLIDEGYVSEWRRIFLPTMK